MYMYMYYSNKYPSSCYLHCTCTCTCACTCMHDTIHHVVHATADSTVWAWLGIISAVQHTVHIHVQYTSKKTFHTVGNKRRINGSVVQKQRLREGMKRSTPRFQRVNGRVQFQRTRRCAVIKAGVKWERPNFDRLVHGWRLVVLE